MKISVSTAVAPCICYSQDHNLSSPHSFLGLPSSYGPHGDQSILSAMKDVWKLVGFSKNQVLPAHYTNPHGHGSSNVLLIVYSTLCLGLGTRALIWYSTLAITQYCHLTAFLLWAFYLPLDQFSALSKPIRQSQPLTWVSGNREGHWQYHWTQIICQCVNTWTRLTWREQHTVATNSRQREGSSTENAVSHQRVSIFLLGDTDVIPSSAQVWCRGGGCGVVMLIRQCTTMLSVCYTVSHLVWGGRHLSALLFTFKVFVYLWGPMSLTGSCLSQKMKISNYSLMALWWYWPADGYCIYHCDDT